jgi:hypothetical protein
MAAQPDPVSSAGPVAHGPFREEAKKTSIHLVRGSAFAGVHPRKQHLPLTIKAVAPIRSPRVLKAE